jgi:YD repeat-containing protein
MVLSFAKNKKNTPIVSTMKNIFVTNIYHMHLPILRIIFICLLPFTLYSQYYYKDIVSILQTTESQKAYKTNKIRKVVLSSFERDDQPSDYFICFQEITPTYNAIKTYTQSVASMQSVMTSQFNGKMQLIRTADSSNSTLNITAYTYDTAGRIQQIDISTTSYVYKQTDTEKHLWMYNDQGKPETMLRIKNSIDTQVVKFICDEKGNPIEEKWFSKGKPGQVYYYYYNDQNLLTDVVKFNDRARKLLPEYIFEYNDASQLSQMISVQVGSNNYLIWKYQYNEKGLKTRDACYSKQKELMGYITYRYE